MTVGPADADLEGVHHDHGHVEVDVDDRVGAPVLGPDGPEPVDGLLPQLDEKIAVGGSSSPSIWTGLAAASSTAAAGFA